MSEAFEKWKSELLSREPEQTGRKMSWASETIPIGPTTRSNVLDGERHFIGDCDYCDKTLDGKSMRERIAHYVKHESRGDKPDPSYGEIT